MTSLMDERFTLTWPEFPEGSRRNPFRDYITHMLTAHARTSAEWGAYLQNEVEIHQQPVASRRSLLAQILSGGCPMRADKKCGERFYTDEGYERYLRSAESAEQTAERHARDLWAAALDVSKP